MNEEVVRPPWPRTWMNFAKSVAEHSVDPALKVGAVIVAEDNTSVLSIGYNGMWRGGPNVVESLERGKSGTIHAEVNALIKCDFNFHKRKYVYVTHSPCRECAKLIVNASIFRVVYDVPYRDPAGLELLCSAGVEVFTLQEAIAHACRGV